MALHQEKPNSSSQGATPEQSATQLPAKEPSSACPPGPIGPIFTPADLKRALDVLDICLQNYGWHAGDNKLREDWLLRVMHEQGLTRALIKALVRRLIAEQVFQPGSHTIPAGHRREPGQPFVFVRLNPETIHYLMTTEERWYSYLAQQRLAAERPSNPNKSNLEKNGAITALSGIGATPDSVEDSKPTAPACRPERSPTRTDFPEAFADFSKKQRQLLLRLNGQHRVPIAEMKKAIYGKTSVDTKTLEQLLTRTNRCLATKNYPLEIKRQANTLQLLPI